MNTIPPPSLARGVMRAVDRAALSTARRGDAWPYGSLVLVALDHDASALMLLSALAEHTRNLREDPRVSLLFDGTAGYDQPLEGPRVTVLGRAERTVDPRHRDRFMARHPDAASYQGFGDFALYRVVPARAHMVAGFGAVHWIEGAELALDAEDHRALVAAEADIVAHMNGEHADAIDAYAAGLLGLAGGGWRMTGIDPEGVDLRRGGSVGRLTFDRPVDSPESARAALVRLARQARAALGGEGEE